MDWRSILAIPPHDGRVADRACPGFERPAGLLPHPSLGNFRGLPGSMGRALAPAATGSFCSHG